WVGINEAQLMLGGAFVGTPSPPKTLALNASTGSWNLVGGTILGGTVTSADGATLLLPNFNFGTLDGVTLNADMTVGDGAQLYVSNGLTLNGVLTVNNSGNFTDLRFNSGAQILGGTGQVVLTGTSTNTRIALGWNG